MQATFHQATAKAINTQGRTVERWITSLHAALAITPGEGSRWNSIAQAMRENPAVMQKLAAGKIGQVPQGMISAFETLIAAADLWSGRTAPDWHRALRAGADRRFGGNDRAESAAAAALAGDLAPSPVLL